MEKTQRNKWTLVDVVFDSQVMETVFRVQLKQIKKSLDEKGVTELKQVTITIEVTAEEKE